MKLRIAGLYNFPQALASFQPTHLISLVDPCEKAPHPAEVPTANHLIQKFLDVERPLDGYSPKIQHMESLLGFTRGISQGDRLLVHCHGGISRSPAAAFAILVQRLGVLKADVALYRVLKRAPLALPNRLIVAYADQLLRADGLLLAVLDAHRQADMTRRLKESHPDFAEMFQE